MLLIFGEAKANLIASISKNRDYYKKVSAAPLKLHKFCSLLHAQILSKHDKLGKLQCKWV